MSILVPDELLRAVSQYHERFGCWVPSETVMMFASQPGPLVVEIRQAIALGRAIPAWSASAKREGGMAVPPWYRAVPR